jgi:putative ubiquitin-RnfH superfamily antitoxin RatB of RatAB toxin-antitoxin module
MSNDPLSPNMTTELVCGHGYRRVQVMHLHIKPGSTVFEALQCALQMGLRLEVGADVLDAQSQASSERARAWLDEHLQNAKLFLSVWGTPCLLDAVLQSTDRLEITKSLRVDPKVARRERFKQQGAKAAGLFAHKRAGSKAGY